MTSGSERCGGGPSVPGRAGRLLAAALVLASGCEGAGGGARRGDADVLDLMARKPDAALEGGPRGPEGGTPRERAARRTVEEHRSAFQACIERDSKGKASARARATLVLTVGADGAVAEASVAERKVRDAPLGRCLVEVARRMAFAPSGGPPLRLEVPLELTAR